MILTIGERDLFLLQIETEINNKKKLLLKKKKDLDKNKIAFVPKTRIYI